MNSGQRDAMRYARLYNVEVKRRNLMLVRYFLQTQLFDRTSCSDFIIDREEAVNDATILRKHGIAVKLFRAEMHPRPCNPGFTQAYNVESFEETF
jgi:hypothetical protein